MRSVAAGARLAPRPHLLVRLLNLLGREDRLDGDQALDLFLGHLFAKVEDLVDGGHDGGFVDLLGLHQVELLHRGDAGLLLKFLIFLTVLAKFLELGLLLGGEAQLLGHLGIGDHVHQRVSHAGGHPAAHATEAAAPLAVRPVLGSLCYSHAAERGDDCHHYAFHFFVLFLRFSRHVCRRSPTPPWCRHLYRRIQQAVYFALTKIISKYSRLRHLGDFIFSDCVN